jgi:Family of unknown function (DUF6338)
MLPTDSFALLVILALFPGWIYFRLAETRAPRPGRSQLAELLELATVGFAATGMSAVVIALVSSIKYCSFLFNVEVWARTRGPYLGDHLAAALASAAFCIALSCALALVLFAAIFRRRPGSIKPGSTVWFHTLATAPTGMQNWVAIHRRDGSLVEGLLLSCTVGSDEDKREVSLTAPILLTEGAGKPIPLPMNRVLIPSDEITSVTVTHVPIPVRQGGASASTTKLNFGNIFHVWKWISVPAGRVIKRSKAVWRRLGR